MKEVELATPNYTIDALEKGLSIWLPINDACRGEDTIFWEMLPIRRLRNCTKMVILSEIIEVLNYASIE